ncbi:MAG: VTT domain-containing protein [Pseudomonadota bacterium]
MSIKTRIKGMINSKYMLPGIGLASFLESIIVPIPLETLLIPLMHARREHIWAIAAVTTLGCLLGAAIGYAVGYYFFEIIKNGLFTHITTETQFNEFRDQINQNGFLFVFSTGVTPVPLQVAMFVAGVTHYSFGFYMLAVAISRCIRYFGFALLVRHFGDKTEKVIRKYKWQVGFWILFLILLAIIYRTFN